MRRFVVTSACLATLLTSGWFYAVPPAYAVRPAQSCTTKVAVNTEGKDLDDIRKSQLHSYVWTPYGTGNECLRVNSIMMGEDNDLVYPYVEFGWKMGWSTCAASPTYTRVPIAFMVWQSDAGYKCYDTDSTGSRYLMDENTWEWFTLTTEGSGTGKWRGTTAGPRTFRVSGNLFFSTGFPVFMNAERHCDNTTVPNGCDSTLGWGNFDKLKVVQGGVSQPLSQPIGWMVPNDDPDFHQEEDPTTVDGNHWRSDCDTSPCANTI